jgi:DNA helicase II / ATP-dependent DNA helicase PcrA
VHVLTGHAGKGQGFDKVVVLGFEEGQIPIFHVKNLDDGMPEVREELALLHVMASRAKEELVFTYTKIIGRHQQQMCRWATLIKPHVEIVSCLPD